MEHGARSAATQIIMRSGHVIVWLPDPNHDHIAYTSGLCDRPGRAYELALTGQDRRVCEIVLNGTVDFLLLNAIDPAEGLELQGVINHPIRFHRVGDTSSFIGMRSLYGHQPVVWQILLPDPTGRFPQEPGYRKAFRQPVL